MTTLPRYNSTYSLYIKPQIVSIIPLSILNSPVICKNHPSVCASTLHSLVPFMWSLLTLQKLKVGNSKSHPILYQHLYIFTFSLKYRQAEWSLPHELHVNTPAHLSNVFALIHHVLNKFKLVQQITWAINLQRRKFIFSTSLVPLAHNQLPLLFYLVLGIILPWKGACIRAR